MGIVRKIYKRRTADKGRISETSAIYTRIRMRFVCFGKRLSVYRKNILEIKYIQEV